MASSRGSMSYSAPRKIQGCCTTAMFARWRPPMWSSIGVTQYRYRNASGTLHNASWK